MAIRISGPLPIQEISNEFGGSVPHALSEYYADGVFVKNEYNPKTPPIPNKGVGNNTIKVGDFYGKGKKKAVTVTITSNESSVNVYATKFRSLVQNEIQDVDATLIINSGVTLTGNPALIVTANDPTRLNGFRSTDSITIINNGNIIGNAGTGGDGGCASGVAGKNGTVGGMGVQLYRATSIINNGTIAGGASGGKGGTGGVITSYNQRAVAATRKYCPPAQQQRSQVNVCNTDENCRGVGWMSCGCRRPCGKTNARCDGRYGRGRGQQRTNYYPPCQGSDTPARAQNNDVRSTDTCGGKGGDGATPFSNTVLAGGNGGGGGATNGNAGGKWGEGGSYYLKGANSLVGTVGGTLLGLSSATP